MTIITQLINGQSFTNNERHIDIENPSTGDVLRQMEVASQTTVGYAVQAAKAALPQWKASTPLSRARIFYRFKQLIEDNEQQIVALISEEHGKTREDAAGELKRGVENIEYAIAAPELLKGEFSRNVGTDIDSWSTFYPVGIVAGITPFNFPAMVPLWMYPLAIVCGNTFILKPSEKAPSSTLFIAHLLQQAGLPAGVLNVVNGDKETVDALIHHPDVNAISFIGSTPVAEYIYQQGTQQGKRVQALGGAKNHAVVMPDADLDNTVNALMGAAYGSCGERCMAISVVVCIGDKIANALIQKLIPNIQSLKIGSGTEFGFDMGPLISQAHLNKVIGYIDDGINSGAQLLVDGRNFTSKDSSNGFFLGGCLFDYVTPQMKIYQEEIFGPVLCIVRVESLEQAIQLINKHEYGNGTCLFTRDGGSAHLFMDEIEVGMVGINIPLPVPVAFHSFGGWKRSLFGDLHAYGPDGVRFYTRRKTITQRWPKHSTSEASQFTFLSGHS